MSIWKVLNDSCWWQDPYYVRAYDAEEAIAIAIAKTGLKFNYAVRIE